jgi:hypothetical protein
MGKTFLSLEDDAENYSRVYSVLLEAYNSLAE